MCVFMCVLDESYCICMASRATEAMLLLLLPKLLLLSLLHFGQQQQMPLPKYTSHISNVCIHIST